MGYDMQWRVRPNGEARPSYFQVNIHGMSLMLDVMETLGMVFNDGPRAPFPTEDQFGVTQKQFEAFLDGDDVDATPSGDPTGQMVEDRCRDLHEAMELVLSEHRSATRFTIPDRKFSTNDGWIVTPEECEAASQVWVNHARSTQNPHAIVDGSGIPRNLWDNWLRFLKGAVSHGGFEVS